MRSWLNKRFEGKRPSRQAVENIDLVDSLADIGSFAVQVLIHVGNGTGIDVHSGLPGPNFRQPGARGAADAYPDTGLKNAMAGDDDIPFGIDDGLVQRMRESADHAVCGVPGQQSVSIKGNHETDRWQDREIADGNRIAVFAVAQKPVEFDQLSTLAFPAHPCPLTRVVAALTVKQEEDPAPWSAYFSFRRSMRSAHSTASGSIFERRRLRVGQVGEQSEVQVGILISEKADLQIIDDLSHLLLVQQKRWNGDECDARVWNPFGKSSFGMDLRRQERERPGSSRFESQPRSIGNKSTNSRKT